MCAEGEKRESRKRGEKQEYWKRGRSGSLGSAGETGVSEAQEKREHRKRGRNGSIGRGGKMGARCSHCWLLRNSRNSRSPRSFPCSPSLRRSGKISAACAPQAVPSPEVCKSDRTALRYSAVNLPDFPSTSSSRIRKSSPSTAGARCGFSRYRYCKLARFPL